MKQFKIVCNVCGRGFEDWDRDTVHAMARVHAREQGYRLPAHFKFVALETYTLVVED